MKIYILKTDNDSFNSLMHFDSLIQFLYYIF